MTIGTGTNILCTLVLGSSNSILCTASNSFRITPTCWCNTFILSGIWMSEIQDKLSWMIHNSWWLKFSKDGFWTTLGEVNRTCLNLAAELHCIVALHTPGFKVQMQLRCRVARQSCIAPPSMCRVALHLAWKCRVAMQSCKEVKYFLSRRSKYPPPPLALHQTVRLDVRSTSRFAPNCKIGCKIHLSLCTKL